VSSFRHQEFASQESTDGNDAESGRFGANHPLRVRALAEIDHGRTNTLCGLGCKLDTHGDEVLDTFPKRMLTIGCQKGPEQVDHHPVSSDPIANEQIPPIAASHRGVALTDIINVIDRAQHIAFQRTQIQLASMLPLELLSHACIAA